MKAEMTEMNSELARDKCRPAQRLQGVAKPSLPAQRGHEQSLPKFPAKGNRINM
jgi:hypothetical protein